MHEQYQALARRYRPKKFSEVVGQAAVITTLKNSIRLSRVAHAYLFSGSRGVGKTTLARLFAKALNCKNLGSDQEPCNECSSCLEIASGRSLDVIEIDGASNRGIDDIRQINETIGYAPATGMYKIYIIDEVHMLTKEAFNALLKTIEEPPPMSKFFLATTEPHKVLATIVSRCQRFDLTRIPQEWIVEKLDAIAQDVKRMVQPDALHLIARLSEGSLRDAESLLDQLFSYEEGVLTTEMVRKNFGFLPQDYFFYLDQAIYKGSLSFAFECAEAVFRQGKNVSYFFDELLEHYRFLLLSKMGDEGDRFSHLSSHVKQRYKEQAGLYREDHLLYIMEYLLGTLPLLQKSSAKQVTTEMILLHLIKSKDRLSLPALVRRLMALEEKIGKKDVAQEEPILQKKVVTEPVIVKERVEEKIVVEEKKESLHKSHYDTLLRFAAVELEGTLQTDGEK